jgi:hypothetical protein
MYLEVPGNEGSTVPSESSTTLLQVGHPFRAPPKKRPGRAGNGCGAARAFTAARGGIGRGSGAATSYVVALEARVRESV